MSFSLFPYPCPSPSPFSFIPSPRLGLPQYKQDSFMKYNTNTNTSSTPLQNHDNWPSYSSISLYFSTHYIGYSTSPKML